MKKDKNIENNHPLSGFSTAEAQTSSTQFALQQLKKASEKRESAAEAVKVRCRICFKEIAPTPRCFGHGGGGGGNGGDAGKASEENSSLGGESTLIKPEKQSHDIEVVAGGANEGLESLSNETNFDPDIIAVLVKKGLLQIDNDRNSLSLTIKLQCDPKLLTKEQRHELKKYINAIQKEFNEFKEKHHLTNDYAKTIHDEKGNIISLRITMPTLVLHDAFIQRLANNLVPTPHPNFQAKKEQGLAPNPLSVEQKPSHSTEEEVADNEKQSIFRPSPFKKEPW